MSFQAYHGTITAKNGMEIFIRQIQTGDNVNYKNFFNSLSERSRRLFVPHRYTDDVLNQYITRAIEKEDLAYFAFDGEKCVGYFFLWYFHTETPILGIGVHDSYQGLGLGQAFLDILISDAKKEHKNGIELTTMVDNETAFAVYRKKGFLYLGNVTNVLGTGEKVTERRLFLPIREDAAVPDNTVHASPI